MARRSSQGSFNTLNFGSVSLKSSDPHPEEWTLVGTHKMEKREPFELWYNDLQACILNCATQINESLEQNPHPNIDLTQNDLDYSRHVINEETQRVMTSVYFERQPPNDNPVHFHLPREHEIRMYRGL